jgi:endonuclease-3
VPAAQARNLDRILAALAARYDTPPTPKRSAFEWVLWENVAYLLSDEKRAAAFRGLANRIGTAPSDILSASSEALLEVASLGGMRPPDRAARLRSIAEIALRDFQGDVSSVLRLPPAQAKKALKRFPGIGDPGAEKILLLTGAAPVLALESNGLRVLLRLGFGEEKKSYAATYRAVQAAAEAGRGLARIICSAATGKRFAKPASPAARFARSPASAPSFGGAFDLC